jgi:hypothetical protein
MPADALPGKARAARNAAKSRRIVMTLLPGMRG